jgi:hypothetical protein
VPVSHRMLPRSVLGLVAATVVATVACADGDRAPAVDFVGADIAPPAPLNKLRAGMSFADATAVVPELRGELGELGSGQLTFDPKRAGLSARVDLRGSRVDTIWYFREGPSFSRTLAERWGPGSVDATHPGIIEWTGPSWLASHSCNDALTRCALMFTRLPRPLRRESLGAVAAPFGTLAPLRIGMAEEQARELAPGLVGAEALVDADLGFDDASASVRIVDHQVAHMDAFFFDPKVLDVVRAAWGAETGRCWYGDPWRACIASDPGDRTVTIEFDTVVPLATMFGDGDAIAYFAKHPLFGRTIDEVERAFADPRRGGERGALALPDTEYGATALEISALGGTVTGAELWLGFSGEAEQAATFAFLAAKWAANARMPTRDRGVTLHAKSPTVVIRADWRSGHPAWRLSIKP